MRRGIIATAGILYEGLSRLGAGDTISPEVINYSTYPKYPASDTYLLPGPYGSMNPDPRKGEFSDMGSVHYNLTRCRTTCLAASSHR